MRNVGYRLAETQHPHDVGIVLGTTHEDGFAQGRIHIA